MNNIQTHRYRAKPPAFAMGNESSFMDTIIHQLETLYYPDQIDYKYDEIKNRHWETLSDKRTAYDKIQCQIYFRHDEYEHTYNLFYGRTTPYTEDEIDAAIGESLPSFKEEPLYDVRLAALHELFRECESLYVVVPDPEKPGQPIKDLNDHSATPKPLTHETHIFLSSEEIQLIDAKLCKLTDLYLHLTQDEKLEKIRQSDLDITVVELLLNERLKELEKQSPRLYTAELPHNTSFTLDIHRTSTVKSFAQVLVEDVLYMILEKPDLGQWAKFLFAMIRSDDRFSFDNTVRAQYDYFNNFFNLPLEYQVQYSFVIDAFPANMLRWIKENHKEMSNVFTRNDYYNPRSFSHIYKDFNDESMINSEKDPAEGYKETKHPGYAIKLRQAFQIQLDQAVLKEIQHLRKQYNQAHKTEFNVSVALIMISALTAGAYLNQMILWSTAAHIMIPAAIVSFVYAQWIITRPYLADASEKNQPWDRYNLGFMLLSSALVLSIAFLINTPIAPLIVIANLSSLSAHYLHRYIAFKQLEHAPCLSAVEAVTNDIKVQTFGSIFEIEHKKVNFKPLNCDTKTHNDESAVSLMHEN